MVGWHNGVRYNEFPFCEKDAREIERQKRMNGR